MRASPSKTPQILLGFDFGMKKMGVAVGQIVTKSATPLTLLKAKDGIPSWEQIKDLIKTWGADTLVVGIPYNMDGSEQEVTFAAKKFAVRLKNHYHLPVFLVDERLTSVQARHDLNDKSNLQHADTNVDSVAAKLILESWFRDHKTAE
jgi:putative holliday junction resolvase